MKRALFLGLALLPYGAAHAEPRNPLDALKLEDLSATRERPLFVATRRAPAPMRAETPPPAPPPVEEKAVALGPPPFDLIGAVVGKRESIALLRNKTTSEVLRLRPGEEAEGWRVGAVGLRSVALERDGRKESLALAGPPTDPAGPVVAGEPQPAESAAAPPAPDLKHLARRARMDH
jgi:general secretion pathway protein N